MAKFEIILSDPLKYKNEIIQFWEDYLTGTGAGRFDWMQNNPAGSSIWLLAFEMDSKELAGMISIMLHEVLIEGEKIRSGIVGDFMISNKYRVFGPALPLLKAAVGSKDSLDLDFLYTVPNPASMKLTARVGFSERIKMCHFVRPIKTESYIASRVKNKIILKVLSIGADAVLSWLPIRGFISKNDDFE
ncbi:MAG: hypothetical protein KAU21_07565, partial [Gammaproteobacteria bacterium]|nr:hypothetical protein [Gammaproteobacteria bacterium]